MLSIPRRECLVEPPQPPSPQPPNNSCKLLTLTQQRKRLSPLQVLTRPTVKNVMLHESIFITGDLLCDTLTRNVIVKFVLVTKETRIIIIKNERKEIDSLVGHVVI